MLAKYPQAYFSPFARRTRSRPAFKLSLIRRLASFPALHMDDLEQTIADLVTRKPLQPPKRRLAHNEKKRGTKGTGQVERTHQRSFVWLGFRE